MDLIVNNGLYEEILIDFDYEDASLTWKKNAENEFKMTVYKSDYNEFAYGLIDNEVILTVGGQRYVIKTCEPKEADNLVYKEVAATHISFDIKFHVIHESLTKTMRIQEALSFIFNGNKHNYTYEILGDFGTTGVEVENFGNGSNGLSLIQSVIKKYNAVVINDNKHFIFIPEKNWGISTEQQFRYEYNTRDTVLSIDSTELRTSIKLTGKEKDEEEGGGYYFEPFYIESDNKDLLEAFPNREQEPINDERFTDRVSMEAYGRETLHDHYDISLSFKNTDTERIDRGEQRVFIHEKLGIYEEVKVVGLTEYPFSQFNKPQEVILSNEIKDMVSIQNQIYKATKNFNNMIIDNPKGFVFNNMPTWSKNIVRITIPQINQDVEDAKEAIEQAVSQGQADKKALEEQIESTKQQLESDIGNAVIKWDGDFELAREEITNEIMAETDGTAILNKLMVDDLLVERLYADNAFITNLNTKTLNAVSANIVEIRTEILTANVIEADMIQSSQALFDKVFADEAFFKQIAANQAFIESLQVQKLTGVEIVAGTISGSTISSFSADRQSGITLASGKLTSFDQRGKETYMESGSISLNQDTRYRMTLTSNVLTYADNEVSQRTMMEFNPRGFSVKADATNTGDYKNPLITIDGETKSYLHFKLKDANGPAFQINVENQAGVPTAIFGATRFIFYARQNHEFRNTGTGGWQPIQAGGFINSSSREYKENISLIREDRLNEFMSLNFYNYNRSDSGAIQEGLIYEEVKHMPFAINDGIDQYSLISYLGQVLQTTIKIDMVRDEIIDWHEERLTDVEETIENVLIKLTNSELKIVQLTKRIKDLEKNIA